MSTNRDINKEMSNAGRRNQIFTLVNRYIGFSPLHTKRYSVRHLLVYVSASVDDIVVDIPMSAYFVNKCGCRGKYVADMSSTSVKITKIFRGFGHTNLDFRTLWVGSSGLGFEYLVMEWAFLLLNGLSVNATLGENFEPHGPQIPMCIYYHNYTIFTVNRGPGQEFEFQQQQLRWKNEEESFSLVDSLAICVLQSIYLRVLLEAQNSRSSAGSSPGSRIGADLFILRKQRSVASIWANFSCLELAATRILQLNKWLYLESRHQNDSRELIDGFLGREFCPLQHNTDEGKLFLSLSSENPFGVNSSVKHFFFHRAVLFVWRTEFVLAEDILVQKLGFCLFEVFAAEENLLLYRTDAAGELS
ncbi:hypothetical protein ACFE04_016261 [Oxalis oulophora]